MPILKDFRNTRVITLPSFAGSEVELYESLLFGDAYAISDLKGENALEAIVRIIKRWNFTNEDGTPMPVSKQSLGLLPPEDAAFLSEEITKFLSSQKKS